MSEERDHGREASDPPHGRAEEPDPTGVRAILSALPDPGPMPLDVVRRITASLEVEQARGETEPRGGHPLPTGHRPVSSLTQARARRGPGGGIAVIAAAASVVVLAGAVVMGLLMTGWGLGMGSSSDSAVEQVAGAAADDSGAQAQERSEAFGSTESATGADGSLAPDGAKEGSSSDAVAVLATGAMLTGSTVADHARTLREDPTTLGRDVDAEVARTGSTVGTSQGAAACLSGLLSIPSEEALALLAGVDIVRFDNTFAAVIVAADPGASVDRGRIASSAYLVPLDCGPRTAALLHAPVRIRS